jgi:hypothetical protein
LINNKQQTINKTMNAVALLLKAEKKPNEVLLASVSNNN